MFSKYIIISWLCETIFASDESVANPEAKKIGLSFEQPNTTYQTQIMNTI